MRLPARRPLVLVPAITLGLGALTIAPQVANAGPGESTLIADTNNARTSNGLPAYAVAGDLTSIARSQAARMAARGYIYHNPSLTSQVCCWSDVGENVGVGPSATAVHNAFMASSPHRSNILSGTFTQVGIGTAVGSDGRVYVDEVFRRPTGASAPQPAPKPAPTPKPVPAPTARHHTTSTRTYSAPSRASRSSTRAPLVVHLPDAAQLFAQALARLEHSPQLHLSDPVGRTLTWSTSMQRLADSARH